MSWKATSQTNILHRPKANMEPKKWPLEKEHSFTHYFLGSDLVFGGVFEEGTLASPWKTFWVSLGDWCFTFASILLMDDILQLLGTSRGNYYPLRPSNELFLLHFFKLFTYFCWGSKNLCESSHESVTNLICCRSQESGGERLGKTMHLFGGSLSWWHLILMLDV